MRLQRGTRGTAVNDPVRIAEEIADRMVLESAPGAAAVASFVITRAAQRAWEAINQQLNDARGALFWIDGPSGTGKTHFLNYVIALNRRAGSLGAELARNLTLAIRVEGRAGNVEQILLQSLAQELSGVRHKAGALWRRLTGKEAIAAALDQAYRQGVRAVTVAIDFGDAKIGAAEPELEMLAGLATSLRHPELTVIAAGRNPLSVATSTFAVAPEDGEVLTVAIGRRGIWTRACGRRRTEPIADSTLAGTTVTRFIRSIRPRRVPCVLSTAPPVRWRRWPGWCARSCFRGTRAGTSRV